MLLRPSGPSTMKTQGCNAVSIHSTRYHQENSAALMKELELWLTEQIEQKKVEPNNSGRGHLLIEKSTIRPSP